MHIECLSQGNDDVSYSSISGTNQRHFMYTTMDGRRRNGNFFIKVDHSLINDEDHPIKAFDIIFKLHFVFNIDHAKLLENFYDFILGCIRKITQRMKRYSKYFFLQHTCLYLQNSFF